MKLFFKFLKHAICAVIILNCPAAFAEIISRSREMRFVLNEIDENGLFVAASGQAYRILAIVPKPNFAKYVKEHLVGQELHCDNAGTTGTRRKIIVEAGVKAIDCNPTYSVIGRHSASLQEELIKAGVALEYCPESQNRFKTCKAGMN